MARLGAEVTGIDLSEKPLGVAKLHLLETGQKVDYRKIAVEQLAEEMPGTFDAVTCLEMLEHVPNPSSVVSACARLVKPGGQVFFLDPEPQSEILSVRGARCRIHPQDAAQGHARLRQVHQAIRTGPLGQAGAAGAGRDAGHELQPADSRNIRWDTTPASIICCAPPGMFEAVLFDLDGTLADTAPDLGGAANFCCSRKKVDRNKPLDKPCARTPRKGCVACCTPGFDHRSTGRTRITNAWLPRFLEIYAARLCDESTACSTGIPELLDRIGKSQALSWGIVTNKRMRFTDPLVELLQLSPRTCCVVSGDTTAASQTLATARSCMPAQNCSTADSGTKAIYVGDDQRDIHRRPRRRLLHRGGRLRLPRQQCEAARMPGGPTWSSNNRNRTGRPTSAQLRSARNKQIARRQAVWSNKKLCRFTAVAARSSR